VVASESSDMIQCQMMLEGVLTSALKMLV